MPSSQTLNQYIKSFEDGKIKSTKAQDSHLQILKKKVKKFRANTKSVQIVNNQKMKDEDVISILSDD